MREKRINDANRFLNRNNYLRQLNRNNSFFIYLVANCSHELERQSFGTGNCVAMSKNADVDLVAMKMRIAQITNLGKSNYGA